MTQLDLPHMPPPPDTLERLQADVLALEGEFLGASMNQRAEFDIRARVDALRVRLAALLGVRVECIDADVTLDRRAGNLSIWLRHDSPFWGWGCA